MYGDVLFIGDGNTLTLYQDGQMIERVTILSENEVILHEDFSNLGRGGRQEPTVQEFLVSDLMSMPEIAIVDDVIEASYASISPASSLPNVHYQVWYGTQPVIRQLTFSSVFMSQSTIPPGTIVSGAAGQGWSVLVALLSGFLSWAMAGHVLVAFGGSIVGALPRPFSLNFNSGFSRAYNVTARDPGSGRTATRPAEIFRGTARVNNGVSTWQNDVTVREGWSPDFAARRDIILANSWFGLFWWADVFVVLW